MSRLDLNLLFTLEAVLEEGSVARAAKRLHLSPSAMSRALARLRDSTGDPLLVRSGRGLVPTPRALELREQVKVLLQEAELVLRPAGPPDLQRLSRTFTVRVREGFVENFGLALIQRVQQQAPRVRLCFLQKPDRESLALREGTVDLEVGVVGTGTHPELKVQALFEDRFVGVVGPMHVLCGEQVTPERFVQGQHIGIPRSGGVKGPIDGVLETLGLEREVVVGVGDFSTALALVRASDLIACVPERYTANLRAGLCTFPLPFAAPEITVSMLWHPRMDMDPAHRWLRQLMAEVCLSR